MGEKAAMSELLHAWDLFDDPDRIHGLSGTGVIIGGGLTSAHLCAQLAPHGQVHLLIRRDLRVKQYDLEISWMGSARRERRREYENTPLEKRAAINKEVRDGGSITPALHAVISKLQKQGSLKIHEYTEVIAADYDEGWTVVLSDDEVLSADYVICATGTFVDVSTDPLLADLQKSHPIQMLSGLPVLTKGLQWGDAPVHIMGNLAALELGPDAVNMNGAVRGALRIWTAMQKQSGESAQSTLQQSTGESDESTVQK